MKLTIFTSNHPRHNYLIELLSSSCTELFVIQESKKKINSGSNLFTINKYFENVKKSEIKYFGNNFNFKNKNIYIKKIEANMLSKINLENRIKNKINGPSLHEKEKISKFALKKNIEDKIRED